MAGFLIGQLAHYIISTHTRSMPLVGRWVGCLDDLRRFSGISAISRLGSRRWPISEIVVARPAIEPRTSWSAGQELNHYTTAAPCNMTPNAYDYIAYWMDLNANFRNEILKVIIINLKVLVVIHYLIIKKCFPNITNLRTYYRTGLYYRFWLHYQILEVSIENCNGYG